MIYRRIDNDYLDPQAFPPDRLLGPGAGRGIRGLTMLSGRVCLTTGGLPFLPRAKADIAECQDPYLPRAESTALHARQACRARHQAGR
ncbi:MAG: hypothetical protein J2P48_06110 [Alphaproteobacteria bacterium]|nr:hypothetical protein [Alphaproteobacteria bacterium]